MLRPTRINPNISADTHLHGTHDFNKHPFAPPGTKAVAHLKPDQRKSWDKHGILGWYVGPSFQHYRCYRVYIPKTGAERISDTVDLFSQHAPTPSWNPEHELLDAMQTFTSALQHPGIKTSSYNCHKLKALKQLAAIFKTNSVKKELTMQKTRTR